MFNSLNITKRTFINNTNNLLKISKLNYFKNSYFSNIKFQKSLFHTSNKINFKMSSSNSDRKLVMIPGPIEFSDGVLNAMSTPSQSHTSPEFIKVFQEVLVNTRKLFQSTDPSAQPIVISASGTLGWEICGANLVDKEDKVLVLSTGFFSDSFADCLRIYSDNVDVIDASSFGNIVPYDLIESKLKSAKESGKPYNVITITQVDTSSGVLSNVEKISSIVKSISPETLIVVDGVCSIAVEDLKFDAWGIDYALTASQKAIGVPSGLSISFASGRALEKALNPNRKVTSFYSNLKKWVPIMKAYESGNPAYFATPPIQLIHALRQSLREILSVEGGVETRILKHHESSEKFKNNLNSIGLKLVPEREVAANGLSAIYFPEGIDGPALLKKISDKGINLATGIYKDYKTKYFRVGHMGVSSIGEGRHDVDLCFKYIKESLQELGYKQ